MLDPVLLADLVALSRTGSLSAAARRQGVSISTISRRLDRLEALAGLRLLDRRASGVRLTPQGSEIAELAQPLDEQIGRVERAAAALRSNAARVPVRVSATEFVVSDVLAPGLPRLITQRADFPLSLHSEGEVVSLASRDADLAVRMSRPEGATLFVRRLADIPVGLFAARDLAPDPARAARELHLARLITFDDTYGRIPEQRWIVEAGLASRIALRTSSLRGQLTAVLAGAGMALLPLFLARRHPELVEIPFAHGIAPRTAWLAVHRDQRRRPEIRLVQRWIVDCFATALSGKAPVSPP